MTIEKKKELFQKAEKELTLANESEDKNTRMNHRNRAWEILFKIIEEQDFLKWAVYDPEKEEPKQNFEEREWEKNKRRKAVNYHDILQDIIIKDIIPHYSPERGSLENYFSFIWKRRKNEAVERNIKTVSLDDQINGQGKNDGDSQVTYEEIIADTVGGVSRDRIEEENIIGRYDGANAIVDMYASLIAYEQSLMMKNGKIDSRKRSQVLWNKLLYTEIVTEITKQILKDVNELDHKTQTFKYVEHSFLDYYMSDICRDYSSLLVTPLKKNGCFDIPQKDPDAELDLPLNTVVWVDYLLTNEEVRITTEKSARSSLTEQTNRFYGYMGTQLPPRD